jgi:hypothetical protein
MANMANISNMSSTRPGWLGWHTRSNISGWWHMALNLKYLTHICQSCYKIQDKRCTPHRRWRMSGDISQIPSDMTRDTWQTRWCIWYENGTAYGKHMIQHMVHIWYTYGKHMVRILHAYGTHMVQHLVCHKHGTRYFHTSETWRSLLTGRLWSSHTMHIKSGQFLHICGSKLFSYNFCPHICPSMYICTYVCTYICTYILHIHLHICSACFCTLALQAMWMYFRLNVKGLRIYPDKP